MIEQAMFYALGFASAGLLALACLPAIWRRAVRLTDRRLRQLVPLSEEEIVAERDQLRAGFAVEQRRSEQRLERAEAERATLLADIGRGDASRFKLDKALGEAVQRADGLAAELGRAEQEIRTLEAASGAASVALNDLTGLSRRRFWEIEAAQERIRELETGIDEGRATVASLETRILGLESRLGDLGQALGNARAELARTVEAVGRAQAERDVARKDQARAVQEGEAMRLQLAHVTGDREPAQEAPPAADAAPQRVEAAAPSPAPRATAADITLVREQLRQLAQTFLEQRHPGEPPAAPGPA